MYGLIKKKKQQEHRNSKTNKYFKDNHFIKHLHKHALYIKVNEKGNIYYLFACMWII